jgi:5-methylcytosine-specific restriction endonuclease McrA
LSEKQKHKFESTLYYLCGTTSGYNRHYRRNENSCEPCHTALLIEWRERRKNPEPINSKRKAWRDRTPNARRDRMHRAKAAGGILGYCSDLQVLELYGTKCHICEKEIDLNASRQVGKPGWENGLHIDHVIPLSKGGNDTIENVRPSHGQCNIVKWAKMPEGAKYDQKVFKGE